MESLENNESQSKAKKKGPSQADRITIGKDEAIKVDAWLKQIQEKSNGMVNLSRSELVNYLLRRKDAELNQSELNQIRRDNYDEVKFTYWALTKIKEAKKAGENITLDDLMRAQRGLVKPVNGPAAKYKKSSRAQNTDQGSGSEESKPAED